MINEKTVFFSRILMETTLTFHIIYATLGVGVPIFIMIAQWVGIRKNDEHYILMARRWTRGYVVSVAVGVVTGTALGLQLTLLWPNFMGLAGNIIALPLFLETFAFFFEAIFLGIYLYTWDRFEDQRKHLLLLVPVAIGGSLSATFITIVNSIMSSPQGFDIVKGEIINVNPVLAMFNPAMPTKVAHVVITAYMTAAFVLAAIAAFRLLKGSWHIYHKKALFLTLKLGLIFSIATAIIGDFSGKYLANYQPEKLAAAEWHFDTRAQASLVMWGLLNKETEEVSYALKIPYGLSILAHWDPNSIVIGLDQFKENLRPPLYIHYLFDSMVTIGMLLVGLSFIYWIGKKLKWKWVNSKIYLWLIILSGPLSVIAVETGWWLTEVGRQPWVLRGIMRTSEAATTNENVNLMLILFSLLYLILGVGTIVVMTRMFKKYPVEKEIEDRMLEKGGVNS
jgi:cytochrome bd ubiquinol oxidase subunit I